MKDQEARLIIAFGIIFTLILPFMLTGSINRVSRSSKIESKDLIIYKNAKITNKLKNLNWGDINPNSTKTEKIFLKNFKNETLIFNVYADNWHPENASKYIIFNSEHDLYSIKPDEVVRINLFLFVKADIHSIKEFSFDIVVDAEELNN